MTEGFNYDNWLTDSEPDKDPLFNDIYLIPDDEKEIEAIKKGILPYFRRYMQTIRTVTDPSSPSHPNKVKEVGHRVRTIRRISGIPRDAVAEQTQVDRFQYMAFEGGMVPIADMPEGFSMNFARVMRNALGDARANQFGIPPINEQPNH